MCGIAGFLNPRNNDKKTEKEIYQILKKMNEVQRHRGPDDEGIFLENGCALGHVRLSILDLYRGHQPMCKKKEGNTYAIILNGEIYNMNFFYCSMGWKTEEIIFDQRSCWCEAIILYKTGRYIDLCI